MRVLLAIAIWLAILPASAGADAIMGPPECPPGARGDSSHDGEWCEPWPCTSDAACGGGSCRTFRVCTRAAMVEPGGRGAGNRTAYRLEQVVASCDPVQACDGTAGPHPTHAGAFEIGAPRCTNARYCVPAPARATPERAAGCAASPSPQGSPWWLGWLLLAIARRPHFPARRTGAMRSIPSVHSKE